MSENGPTEKKKVHFAFVDLVRGILAVYVVVCHWCLFSNFDLFPSAYLAVDYFFMMSGFVIAFAYQSKLRNGYKKSVFLYQRVLRLYPFILAGATVGFAYAAVKSFAAHGFIDFETWRLFAMNVLMIPESLFLTDFAYPLNIPMWFLFFIAVSYVAFAFFLYRAPTWAISLFAALMAALLSTWFMGFFGSKLMIPNELIYELSNFWRCGFSICIGILIFRIYGFVERVRFPKVAIIILAALPMLIMATPRGLMPWWGYQALFVGTFPLAFACGLKVELKGKFAKVAKTAGDFSLPLYIAHMPVLFFAESALYALGIEDRTIHLWLGWIVVPSTCLIVFIGYRMITHFFRKATNLAAPVIFKSPSRG
ncbi:acyltransferase [Henriciella sp. AS95]|uniref:acyltransferase family protein n=1 Tax=Henriciella sp. AS95 TaxID=3135782 RepID=UPI00317026BB